MNNALLQEECQIVDIDLYNKETHSMMIDVFTYHPDFPKPGIMFLGILGILSNPAIFKRVIKGMAHYYRGKSFTAMACIESASYHYASALAYELDLPMLLVRKVGKLPGDVTGIEYSLEYGTAKLELQKNSFHEGDKILLLDDILATGGTSKAAASLIESCGSIVSEIAFPIEFPEFNGRDVLKGYEVYSFLSFIKS